MRTPRAVLGIIITAASCLCISLPMRAAAEPVRWSSTAADMSRETLIGQLATGARVLAVRSDAGGWGIAVRGADLSSSEGLRPIEIEFHDGMAVHRRAVGYERIDMAPDGLRGTAELSQPGGAAFAVEDRWTLSGSLLRLERNVTVAESAPGGFLSGITLAVERNLPRPAIGFFAPGMIYGGTEHLTDGAIGGGLAYRSGDGDVWIREDRLPAPLFGVRFPDGSSIAVLDPEPQGTTTVEDAQDTQVRMLVDARFRFGAIGAHTSAEGRVEVGFRFPGTEGEVTYSGNPGPGGEVHRWRRRYHPTKEGLTQRYRIDFRFGQKEPFPEFYRGAWRWAWRTLDPKVVPHDLEVVRRSLIDMLAERVQTHGRWTGIPNFAAAEAGGPQVDRKAVMGFTGKSLEAANFLLQEADRDATPRGAKLRELGTAIFDSFVRLPMSPPVGEGFQLRTGEPALALGTDGVVYLRSFSDDLKSTVKAIRRERAQGRSHETWLRWAREFADWLLTQQRPDGGFPRSWRPGTGEVADPAPHSSYNPIPFLVLLSQETGERTYLDAALRAGEFTWSGQAGGQFVGGTIDNPDVIDKEAGTLSLEAYLALYEETRDEKWLERAVRAGDFAETWIYLWNVPMPEGADAAALQWKPGVPTVGLQLISTGHSFVDAYMAFDADEYAKLYRYTGDSHYREVARILLHNTKSMLALPGRLYDLKGPGWQQEHWSFAPPRGFGAHRAWLPWVSTSHLNGIFGLEEFDPALFEELSRPESHGAPGPH